MLFGRDRVYLRYVERFFQAQHVVDLPGRSASVTGSLKRAELVDFALWDRDIQPHVTSGSIGADWNWQSLFRRTSIVERALWRTIVGMQITVDGIDPLDGRRVRVPVAQQILTVPYRWPRDPRMRCVFIWYLARAPRVALERYGIVDQFAVTPGLLSSAIALAQLNRHAKGRIGLHADPGPNEQEGQKLFDSYRRNGMSAAPAEGRLSRARAQDGRMFYMDVGAGEAHLVQHPLVALNGGLV